MSCELPDCISYKLVRARKAHVCVECRTTIKPGDQYVNISGIWCGTPDRFRLCLRCDRVRLLAISKYDGHGEDGPAFGDLFEWIRDVRK